MPAPQEVSDLIERFERNHDTYRSHEYNETETRREFIDPLFKTLGWDIDNQQGYAEPYKDVVHEDAIKIGGVTKAPDCAFRVGGMRKFFVEVMLQLHKLLTAVETSQEKTALQRQIDATDKQIDQLVYKLYGLTDKEIRIVEGSESRR